MSETIKQIEKRHFQRKIEENFNYEFEDLTSIKNIKDEINNK